MISNELARFKKGERHNCNNYKGIKSTTNLLQLYAKIFEHHIKTMEELLLTDKQNGFKKDDRLCVHKLKKLNPETCMMAIHH
jgi:hypothetical protein